MEKATTTWVERAGAIGLHLSVVARLILVGIRIFRDRRPGSGWPRLYLMLALHGIPRVPGTPRLAGGVHPVGNLLIPERRPGPGSGILGVAAGNARFSRSCCSRSGSASTAAAQLGDSRSGSYWRAGCSLAVTAGVLAVERELREDLTPTSGQSDWQAWKAPRNTGIVAGVALGIPAARLHRLHRLHVLTMFWPTRRTWPRSSPSRPRLSSAYNSGTRTRGACTSCGTALNAAGWCSARTCWRSARRSWAARRQPGSTYSARPRSAWALFSPQPADCPRAIEINKRGVYRYA